MIVMKSQRTFLFTILAVAIILLAGYVYRRIEPSSSQNKAVHKENQLRLPLRKVQRAVAFVQPKPACRLR
ncbi:hypothetical protein [Chryseolinea lacunae]|uniref:Uncharacterized protein n=1 Tax=Chryseolinea lacunae TaxID=2801331 RepID=A0ABS1KTN7_9BACT|nr:hypothetical protein [Chryseolinea lacunae]MBL0742816.1 hypothetical protein [Chryseolinea lacunae]